MRIFCIFTLSVVKFFVIALITHPSSLARLLGTMNSMRETTDE